MKNFEIRTMNKYEMMYACKNSSQISGQTGLIGHLCGTMDSNGDGFFTRWDDYRRDLNTEAFQSELKEVLNELRFNADYGNVLTNRSSLAEFCKKHPSTRMPGYDANYGFRIDTDKYTYLMRLDPDKDDYSSGICCYCYRRDWFDQHLEQSKHGIRFIGSDYNDKFTIEDGGSIRVIRPDGTSFDTVCRYVDDYHMETTHDIWHICEFAERMEQNSNTVEAIEGLIRPLEKK